MARETLSAAYTAYIDCLNRRDWDSLGRHVHPDVRHNGEALGVAGYRAMLETDTRAIPDLRFTVALLVCDPPFVASRLTFDCTPAGELFGLPVDGRRVRFDEHVFYEYAEARILTVWSLIDKAAIAAQI